MIHTNTAKADVAAMFSCNGIHIYTIHYYIYYIYTPRVWNPSRTSGTASGGSLHQRYYNASTNIYNIFTHIILYYILCMYYI